MKNSQGENREWVKRKSGLSHRGIQVLGALGPLKVDCAGVGRDTGIRREYRHMLKKSCVPHEFGTGAVGSSGLVMITGKDIQGLKRVGRQRTRHKGRTWNTGWRGLEVRREGAEREERVRVRSPG